MKQDLRSVCRVSVTIYVCMWAVGRASGMAAEGPVVINTPSGKLRGETFILADGSRGMRFLGVPYALPPTGSLRFAVS